VHVSIKLMG